MSNPETLASVLASVPPHYEYKGQRHCFYDCARCHVEKVLRSVITLKGDIELSRYTIEDQINAQDIVEAARDAGLDVTPEP